ncbi:MAG TPA: pilus assembly PilX N-terminal domain-containing protein [Thermoanaerobaculia bacterium]|nr:pilus assembly PilX N-terminal domain-containing protein [Thermoanaerobaculia bacterium]
MKTDRLEIRSRERGSAYMAVLLALVVLTILGLSLVLITQTEVQVGANERTVNQTFYAADAGLNVAATIVGTPPPDYTPVTFKLNQVDPGSSSSQNHVADVVTAVAVPVNLVKCYGCSMNQGGSQGGPAGQLWNRVNLVTATADRVAWSGPGTGLPPPNATILGEKTLSQLQTASYTQGFPPPVPPNSYTISRP